LNEIGGRCGFPVLRSFNPQNGKGSRSILKPEESTLLVGRESQDLQKNPACPKRERKETQQCYPKSAHKENG
jgi:hypothetical protein